MALLFRHSSLCLHNLRVTIMSWPRYGKDQYIGTQTKFRPLSPRRADQAWSIGSRSRGRSRRQYGEHLFLGDRPRSATGCEPVGAVQSAEVADQGDAGDGGCIKPRPPVQSARPTAFPRALPFPVTTSGCQVINPRQPDAISSARRLTSVGASSRK